MTPQVQAPSPISLETHPGARVRLTDLDRQAWLDAALALEYPDYRDLDAWEQFRAAASARAPAALEAALEGFFSDATGNYLILENLPVDPFLPAAPLDGKRPAGKQAVSEAVIAGLIGTRAEIFSYANEKSGSPIHEVAPVAGLEQTQSNAGRTAMEFHTDGAFLPAHFRPQGLLLFGLLNIDTATFVLTADQVASAAPPDLLHGLKQPWYRHMPPASFSCAAAPKPGPIVWRAADGSTCVAAASSSIEPVNARAREALREFRALCAEAAPERIVIAPGTALLFRNDRVLHGRQAVRGARWLQRAYFTPSLAPFREATGSDPRAFCFDAPALLET